MGGNSEDRRIPIIRYVCGKNVVKQLLQDGKPIHEVLIQESIRDTALKGRVKERRILVKVLSRKKTDQLLDGNHQGIAAYIDDYKIWGLEGLLEGIPWGKQPLLVVLDGLEDPHNLGVILYICDCIRAGGIIIGKHRNVHLTSTAAKVSIGAIGTVKVSVATNPVQVIKYLKKQDYWVVRADFENSRDYREGQYDIPSVLVTGSEGFDISLLVEKNCDYCVRLLMEGSINSLNAPVATDVSLYQIHIQRHPL